MTDSQKSSRESISLEDFSHVNPVPVASRIGQLVMSGALTGRDPNTSEMPLGIDVQCRNVFARIRELALACGGSTDDILKVTCWVERYRDRDALNREWLAMFPNPASRPARQVHAAQLDGGALIHADVVIVLPEGPRASQ